MSKAELRSQARARLRALDGRAREVASARIAERVWSLPPVAEAGVLLLYAHLPGEVETDAIAAEAARRGVVVTYPRCLPETWEMVLHRVASPGELRAGAYGIREPDADACPLVTTDQIDVALVPGLGWDRHGGRLGRGAGYYDRLFAAPAWRGFRCGLFFAAQEFARLPMDALDVPLEAVVTEEEVWRGDPVG